MGKKEDLLIAFKENVGSWVCGYCNSGSNQPAAVFREIKKEGYAFEETSPNRWSKNLTCETCNAKRTHYKLLNVEPQFSQRDRIIINFETRVKILRIFNSQDAFTGASISSTPEIDHKVPWTRLEADIDASNLSDREIRENFQLLTREHNLLKDRACGHCKNNEKRPPLFGIYFWFSGNENYEGTCLGCGWHDGVEWRNQLNQLLDNGSLVHSI